MEKEVHFYVYGSDDNLPQFNSSNTHKVLMDGNAVPNDEKFYTIMNKFFRLGNDFGNNLDALFDSMTDLSWYDATNFVLVVSNSNDWLNEEDDFDIGNIFKTFEDIAESINDEPLNSTKTRNIKFYFDECDRICDILDDSGVEWEYAD